MSASLNVASDRRTSIVTVALCYVIAALEGIDLQAAGVAAPKLGPAFNMTPEELGVFFSASTFGLMLGAAVGGPLSDRFGRKIVLVVSVFIFGLLSLATAYAPDVDSLIAARFVTGLGLGGALPNLVALVAENTPPAYKNLSVGMLYAGLPTGGAAVSLISRFGAHDDWQGIFIIGGLAPLAVVPVLIFLLPHSRQQTEIKIAEAAGVRHARGLLLALFGENRAVRTLLLWGGGFLGLLSLYLLLNWLPTLLVGRGLSRPDASLVQMSFNIMGIMASVATGWLMDRIAVKKMVLGTFLSAAAALVLLAVTPAELALCIISGGIVGMTVSATQALLYAITPGNYPTAVRGTGVGWAVVAGRLGSATGPLLAGALLGAGRSPQEVLAVLVPTILVAGALIFALAVLMGRMAKPDTARP